MDSNKTLLAKKVISLLSRSYPKAKIALNYSNEFELLVATILSAQSTDKQVNKITPALFSKYKTVKDFANAKLDDLEKMIYSTGFYRNKAKNIKAAAQMILEKFDGKVPDAMDKLITLPGVARKTANIVLYNAFGKNEGIAVDTHVKRLAKRIGLSIYDNPDKIEQDLMNLFPKKMWGKLTYYLIEHGRNVCDAKKPKCEICVIKKYCRYYQNNFRLNN